MYFSTKRKTSILLAAIIVAAGTLVQVSAYTGGEISIILNNSQFTRLNDTGNYQIKVFVDYSVTDPTLIGQKINAVMKVYSSDGSLLKTTSFPGGFPVNKTGETHLSTNIPIPAHKILQRRLSLQISIRQIYCQISSRQLLIWLTP